jgi:hypothetical protein
VALAAAACTQGSGDAIPALCRKGYPDAELVAAYRTTVGVVRARQVGPAHRPAADAWPGRADTDIAAWCYVDVPGSGRAAGAATRGEQPVLFARGDLRPDPSGPRVP